MASRDSQVLAERMEASLRRLMRETAPDSGTEGLESIPIGQLRLVRALLGGPKTASAVSQELGLSASALCQTVQRLVDGGLVEKSEAVEDKRQRVLALTARGERLIKARHQVRLDRLDGLLQRVSPVERETLVSLLEQIAGSDGEAEPAAAVAALDRGLAL